jgi:hypothetical protein
MEGAWGTRSGMSGTVTVEGAIVPGEKREADKMETWRVGGLWRTLVMFVRSFAVKRR